MPVQSFWTLGTGAQGQLVPQEVFVVIFMAIIIGWIVVALWTRVIDNFTYNRLKMNKSSTWDSLLIAVGITIFFVGLVWLVDRYKLVEGTLAAEVTGEDDPFFGRAQEELEQEFLGTAFGGSRNASITTLFPRLLFI